MRREILITALITARRGKDVVAYEFPHESPGDRRALTGTGRRLRIDFRARRTVPGQTYHLVFVTSGGTTAESDDINDYNNFVNEQAGVSGAITENWDIDWYAMGSTSLVDARVNALVTGPVFGLDGTKIADDHDDVWDGSLSAHLNVTQSNTTLETIVWTGSNYDGDAHPTPWDKVMRSQDTRSLTPRPLANGPLRRFCY